MSKLIVRPVNRSVAREMCEAHPHAKTLPNTSKYYMVAYIDGKPAGLAVWGYGIMPRQTPKHLFGDAGHLDDYLELCRFFVYDWCPKNTASQFLSITHRIIKKYAPWIKWLYTYAAGFQGMVGGIYKAANYEYMGRVLCNSFIYIPDVGLVHNIPLWLRYGSIGSSSNTGLKRFQKYVPGAKRWCGYNFRYIFWLCDAQEKARLMQYARFEIVKEYPTEADLEIWLEDTDGTKTPLAKEFAKSVPIVKLRTNRGIGDTGETDSAPGSNRETGGASPTVSLLKVTE